ncbi:ABC transporter ATP-binding protein [Kordia sp.]|uniref:ABC transporter ATP-binding protein n=1 Tax=Kordia sp. TaxID=1965332 RepID=UPI003B5BDE8D
MKEFIIKTENLSFSYAKNRKDIKNLSLKVPKGSIYGFLGPNGSGKTTTIRLLLGLLKKNGGVIELFDKTIEKSRIENLGKIGALIENPSLYGNLNALENLKIAANYRGNISKERIEEVLEIVKLSYAKHKKVKAYSLGMKQRLGLAISLLSEPSLLILDEPTNGLDPKGIIEMRELIKELNQNHGTTIFISSHLLSEIEKTCTHVGIIREGEMLFQDTVNALQESQNDTLKIEIETNDVQKVKEVLSTQSLSFEEINDHTITTTVNHKKDITTVIDTIRNHQAEIYQIKIMNNLEELFLSLTEN